MKGGEEAHGQFDHQHGVRDNQRFAGEAGEPVALTAVVLFGLPSLVFADVVLADRQGAVVRAVIIGAKEKNVPAFQTVEKTVARGLITIPAFPVNELF